MPFCSFGEGAGMFDVTPIENMFLLEYLPTTPGKYLRAYLYARMVCLHPEMGGSIEEMAKSLHMTEDEILEAMDFWERQGLAMRMANRPPTYAILPMRSGMATDPMENHYYEFQPLHARLSALFPEEPLHAKQFKMLDDWKDIFHFEDDAILRMVEDAVKRSRSAKPKPYNIFAKVDKDVIRLAQKYQDKSSVTLEAVELDLAGSELLTKTAELVHRQLAIPGEPTVEELRLTDRWLSEWGFSQEQIMEACAETGMAQKPSFGYLNRILENRRSGKADHFTLLRDVLKELGVRNATPTPDQQKTCDAWLEKGFEPETVRLAAIQCSRRAKHRFEDLEWMLNEWAGLGLFRSDAARARVEQMNRMSDEIRNLLAKCGSDRHPTKSDTVYYERWQAGFSPELIDYAAQCAHGMQVPMRYIDKLLAAWQKAGISDVEAARAQHEAFRAQTPSSSAPVNPALNYEQRSHEETNYSSTFIDLFGDNPNGGDKA